MGRGRGGDGRGRSRRRRGPAVLMERAAGMLSCWGAALGAAVSVPVLLLVAAPYIRCVLPSAAPALRARASSGGGARSRRAPRLAWRRSGLPGCLTGARVKTDSFSLARAGVGRRSRLPGSGASVALTHPRREPGSCWGSAQPRHRRWRVAQWPPAVPDRPELTLGSVPGHGAGGARGEAAAVAAEGWEEEGGAPLLLTVPRRSPLAETAELRAAANGSRGPT